MLLNDGNSIVIRRQQGSSVNVFFEKRKGSRPYLQFLLNIIKREKKKISVVS
jgi:hypothetical protein